MKKIVIAPLIMLMLTTAFSFGQSEKISDDKSNSHNTITKMNAISSDNCDEVENWYKEDLKNNTIFLFLPGGATPIIFEQKDKDFETKYGVTYYDFQGKVPSYSCVSKYSERAIAYLTKKYGENIYYEMRRNVMGRME